MELVISYDPREEAVVLTPEADGETWSGFVRILSDYSGAIRQAGGALRIPHRAFLAVREEIARYLRNHGGRVRLTPQVRALLEAANAKSYRSACRAGSAEAAEVRRRLRAAGFTRELTAQQMHNVCRLAPLPAGATFSVPGAGKTTEALAYFFYHAGPEDRLLVVGPLSAMGAWETQLRDCCPDRPERFVRLRGGERAIGRLLQDDPRLMLISYGQFATAGRLLHDCLARRRVVMVLDESHRIKSGRAGVTPQEILRVSHLPERKLILSGTPCPQSLADLIPQFSFLYPDQPVDEETVADAFRPVYVRTTKAQLGLPPVEHRIISLEMTPLQRELYESLRSETRRQMLAMLSAAERATLRDLGKKIMKVLAFVSNPSLLAGDLAYLFDRRLGALLAADAGPKLRYACRRARELAAEGQKVIIWSQFVKNVRLLTERLQDLGADCIDGSVPTGDEDEEDTREWKIRQFHENREKMVLILNPAAAAESISLHRACRHAIYVDRSFNAAHYLQSEDRIHRLGLEPGQSPVVELLECRGTIDEVVDRRLRQKIRTMAEALNDGSLQVEAIPYDTDAAAGDVDDEDLRAVLAHLLGDGGR